MPIHANHFIELNVMHGLAVTKKKNNPKPTDASSKLAYSNLNEGNTVEIFHEYFGKDVYILIRRTIHLPKQK